MKRRKEFVFTVDFVENVSPQLSLVKFKSFKKKDNAQKFAKNLRQRGNIQEVSVGKEERDRELEKTLNMKIEDDE